MNRCSNCDKEISSEVKFCPHCGTANAQAEETGTRKKVTATRMVACSACNQEVPDHQKYCPKCGHENLNSRFAQPAGTRASESASSREEGADDEAYVNHNDRRPPQYTRQGPMHTIRTSNVEIKLSKEGIYVDTRKPGEKRSADSETTGYAPQPPVPPSTVPNHNRRERRDMRPPQHVRENTGRKKAGAVVLLMIAVIVGMILFGISSYLFGIVGALASIGVGTWIVATRRYERYTLGKLFGIYALCLLVFLMSIGVLVNSNSMFTARSIQMAIPTTAPATFVTSDIESSADTVEMTEMPIEEVTDVDSIEAVPGSAETSTSSYGITRSINDASGNAVVVIQDTNAAAQSVSSGNPTATESADTAAQADTLSGAGAFSN